MLISLSYPVYMHQFTLTQGFGENPAVYQRFTVKGMPLRGHNGLDFAPAPLSISPLNGEAGPEERGRLGVGYYYEALAAADGIVSKVSYEKDGFGLHVWIDHGEFRTLYAHLMNNTLQPCSTVRQGQIIGSVGSTGFSTGIHLHFGLYPKTEPALNGFGGAVDPTPFFGEPVPGTPGGKEFIPTGSTQIISRPTTSKPGIFPGTAWIVKYLKPKKRKSR